MAQAQIQLPAVKFRRAYLSSVIVRAINKCGMNEMADYHTLFGGIVSVVEIDGHTYTGEIETIAEALLDVRDETEFMEALKSVAIFDDVMMEGRA